MPGSSFWRPLFFICLLTFPSLGIRVPFHQSQDLSSPRWGFTSRFLGFAALLEFFFLPPKKTFPPNERSLSFAPPKSFKNRSAILPPSLFNSPFFSPLSVTVVVRPLLSTSEGLVENTSDCSPPLWILLMAKPPFGFLPFSFSPISSRRSIESAWCYPPDLPPSASSLFCSFRFFPPFLFLHPLSVARGKEQTQELVRLP